MTKIIRTVLGDIDPDEVGVILPHEHLIAFPPVRVRPDIDYRLPSVENAIKEVVDYHEAGGSMICEMATHGYGRDVRALQEISRSTGVHILSTTGFVFESIYPNLAFNATEEELVELFVRNITEGMDGTDVKAGWVKCGSSYEKVTGTEKKVIRAAAKAALRTGVSVTTHTSKGSMVFAQVELLTAEGLPPNRINIGHLDRYTLQPGYLFKLARTGVYFAFDNVGKLKYAPDSQRIEMLNMLINEGFVNQILLSTDSGRQSYFKSYGGWPGFAYVLNTFIPMMKQAGISDADIHAMTVTNPRKFIAFEPL
jgi:predicted metal-dependent phosphotriesterase family hydrolase